MLKSFLERAVQTPHLIVPGLFALVNGYWHILKFKLMAKDVHIGKGFRVYGTFHIMGPGKVIMGSNCFVQSKLFKPVSFLTVMPGASIKVGDNVGFSGTTVQCFNKVLIGDWCNIADAYITDSPAHHLSSNRRFLPAHTVPSAPVILKSNIWISTRVVICHGVTIGENSVIGACSLVRHSIPPNSFYAGNPAKFVRSVPPTSDSCCV